MVVTSQCPIVTVARAVICDTGSLSYLCQLTTTHCRHQTCLLEVGWSGGFIGVMNSWAVDVALDLSIPLTSAASHAFGRDRVCVSACLYCSCSKTAWCSDSF